VLGVSYGYTRIVIMRGWIDGSNASDSGGGIYSCACVNKKSKMETGGEYLCMFLLIVGETAVGSRRGRPG